MRARRPPRACPRTPRETKSVAVAVAGRDPREDGVPEERGDRAEDQTDQRADDDGVAAAARGDLVRGGVRVYGRPLDAFGQQQQLRVRRLVLLVGAQRRLNDQLKGVGQAPTIDRRLDRFDLRVVESDLSFEMGYLLCCVAPEVLRPDDLLGELVRGTGGHLSLLRLHTDLDERV